MLRLQPWTLPLALDQWIQVYTIIYYYVNKIVCVKYSCILKSDIKLNLRSIIAGRKLRGYASLSLNQTCPTTVCLVIHDVPPNHTPRKSSYT